MAQPVNETIHKVSERDDNGRVGSSPTLARIHLSLADNFKEDPSDPMVSACKKQGHTQENQSASAVQHHQKASSLMVWALAAYGLESTSTGQSFTDRHPIMDRGNQEDL